MLFRNKCPVETTVPLVVLCGSPVLGLLHILKEVQIILVDPNFTNAVITQWCSYLPRVELVKILKQIYSKNKSTLKKDYEEIRGRVIKSHKNIFGYLEDYGIDECLVQLILTNNNEHLTDNIKQQYLEYRTGSNPSFYFIWISPDLQKTELILGLAKLEEALEELNVKLAERELPVVKELKLQSTNSVNDTSEIEIHFQQILNYIQPETILPDFVYTHQDAQIWIKHGLHYMIIKTKAGPVVKYLKDILTLVFDKRVVGIQLPKQIVDKLFGYESIKSATFEDNTTDLSQIERMTLTDRNLPLKPAFRELSATRERKRSMHKFEFLDMKRSTYVRKEGRITIMGKFKKTDVRKEAMNFLSRLSADIERTKLNNPSAYLKMIEPEDSSVLGKIKYRKGRRVINELAILILQLIRENSNSVYHDFDITEIARLLPNFFYSILEPVCSQIDCYGRLICPNCNNCFSGNLLIKKSKSIHCHKCVEDIQIDQNLEIECKHSLDFEVQDYINLNLNSTGRALINQYYNENAIGINISLDKTIRIRKNSLEVLKSIFKSEVSLDEINGLMRLPMIEDLSLDVKEYQKEVVEYDLKEKCVNYGSQNCRSCMEFYHGNCIQRVVAHFVKGKLWAHSPVEYGDFGFETKFSGQQYHVIGLAKSAGGQRRIGRKARKNPKILTPSKDERLLGQVVDAILYKKANFIMVASGAELDLRLKVMILELCSIYKVKVCFFEKKDFIRPLPTYINDVVEKFGEFKPIF